METMVHETPDNLYPEGQHPLQLNQESVKNEDIVEV
jgi:hypothetical protein